MAFSCILTTKIALLAYNGYGWRYNIILSSTLLQKLTACSNRNQSYSHTKNKLNYCNRSHVNHLLPSTYLTNVKSLTTLTTKIWKVIQNVENAAVWGTYGHSRSLEIAPIDRAHTRYY